MAQPDLPLNPQYRAQIEHVTKCKRCSHAGDLAAPDLCRSTASPTNHHCRCSCNIVTDQSDTGPQIPQPQIIKQSRSHGIPKGFGPPFVPLRGTALESVLGRRLQAAAKSATVHGMHAFRYPKYAGAARPWPNVWECPTHSSCRGRPSATPPFHMRRASRPWPSTGTRCRSGRRVWLPPTVPQMRHRHCWPAPPHPVG